MLKRAARPPLDLVPRRRLLPHVRAAALEGQSRPDLSLGTAVTGHLDRPFHVLPEPGHVEALLAGAGRAQPHLEAVVVVLREPGGLLEEIGGILHLEAAECQLARTAQPAARALPQASRAVLLAAPGDVGQVRAD